MADRRISVEVKPWWIFFGGFASGAFVVWIVNRWLTPAGTQAALGAAARAHPLGAAFMAVNDAKRQGQGQPLEGEVIPPPKKPAKPRIVREDEGAF